jgi:hypothetical protein
MWRARNIAILGLLGVALLAAFAARKPAAPIKGKNKALLVTYMANEPPELPKVEQWLGRPLDGIQVHTGGANWADWESSIAWEVELWKNIARPIFWSVPLMPEGSSLSEAAAGQYDSHYRKAAKLLAAASLTQRKVYVRTGWEFNAEWMPWSAIGKAESYAEAYRHFVKAFRAESPKFLFEWTPNQGDHGVDPATCYPGDAYVDVIGMDFYYDMRWDPKDPLVAWQGKVGGTYGLQWLEDFAHLHKKRTAYPEWGVMTNDAGPYIQKAAEWFSAHDVVYHSYWNSNAAYAGKLSDGQYHDAGQVFRAHFGRLPKAQ